MTKHAIVSKLNKTAVLWLDAAEQQKWLSEHLPNRVCAAWVRLPGIGGEWKCEPELQLGDQDFANLDPVEIWCICRAVEHGRKAAIRWLIEFVGIQGNSKGDPVRPSYGRKDRSGNATDVSIQSFAPEGSGDDLQIALDEASPSAEARFLADVWKACSQSSVHATDRTSHPPEDPPALARAFSIVVGHLQAKLYEPRGEQLMKIVRGQRQLLGAH